jgi:hypothetical protein
VAEGQFADFAAADAPGFFDRRLAGFQDDLSVEQEGPAGTLAKPVPADRLTAGERSSSLQRA